MVEDWVERLTRYGAPNIVLAEPKERLKSLRDQTYKINGRRKHKDVIDLEFIKVTVKDTIGRYFKGGKRETQLVTFETSQGLVFYDTYDNKLAAKFDELGCR